MHVGESTVRVRGTVGSWNAQAKPPAQVLPIQMTVASVPPLCHPCINLLKPNYTGSIPSSTSFYTTKEICKLRMLPLSHFEYSVPRQEGTHKMEYVNVYIIYINIMYVTLKYTYIHNM